MLEKKSHHFATVAAAVLLLFVVSSTALIIPASAAFFKLLPIALLGDPGIRFEDYQPVKTLEEAQQKTVLFQIRVPPQSLLPAGYSLVGAAVSPVGVKAETDPYTNRTFHPPDVTLYYWNQELKPDTFVTDFEKAGGIFVGEAYALGVNTTEPFGAVINEPPAWTSVGWFKGYPGLWSNGYAEIFQFDKNMSYMVQGSTLTRDQVLAIMETLLVEEPASSEAKTNTTSTITTTTVVSTSTTTRVSTVTSTSTTTVTIEPIVPTSTTTTTVTTTEIVADPSTYAWAVSATVAAVVLAVVLVLQRRSRPQSSSNG